MMSVRARLTISFTLLFGAIVIALGIAGYLLVKNDAYLRLDTALQIATGATAMSAEHEFSEHLNQMGGERDLQLVLEGTGSAALNDTEILVREGNRNVAYKAGIQDRFDLRNVPAGALKDGVTLDGFRIAKRIFQAPKFGASYQIYAAKPVAGLLAQLRRIRIGLFVFIPIGLSLAGLAGYLLAMRSLRPLQELAQTVDAVTSSDLSARVRLNNQGDEIGTLGSRFNLLLERLEEAFHVQRRFMADASHQIRTPVTVTLAAAQVTMRDTNADVAECKESLQIIEHQMLQLRRTVEDMFFLSQTDTGSLSVECKPMYLDDAVSDAVRAGRALARPKQQLLTAGNLPEAKCLGDVDLLKQAVLILLDNAVKFTRAGGHIEVKLYRRETDWVCSVSDDGVGISPVVHSRIFERFFRESHPDTDAVAGAGLGLAIAKSIVENHHGTLTLVGSRPGRTTFEMAIPILEDEKAESVQANSLAVRM